MEQGEAGYADTLRAAREAAGKEPGELAAALDMSYESYRDIEWYDDEITSVVSYRDAVTPTSSSSTSVACSEPTTRP